MDPNSFASSTKNAPRKVRFAPKAPPIRVQKPVVAKVEKVEDDAEAAQAQELLRRFNESAMNVKPKSERKVAPTQVAIGHGGSSVNRLMSYDGHPNFNSSQNIHSSSKNRVDKDYKEPWDYYSYYPVTLPLRMPYSGDPELLDEKEFGENSESQTYDEGSKNDAVQLGLMEENPEPTMLFLQLPSKLPMPKEQPSTDTDVKEGSNKPKSSNNRRPSNNVCTFNELPAGFMGKLVVYKSGAVKLKLGDNLFDVSTGVDSTFAQDVVSVNTEEKRCCALGELNNRAIITPDLDSISDNKFGI